jgi:hypothetical protein
MSRNHRKKKPTDAGVLIFVVIGLSLLVLFGVCTVYVKVRSDALGEDIKALESSRALLRERLRKEEADWASLRSPASVENALREHGLVMTWPRREQIVRLYCPDRLPRSQAGGEALEPMRYAHAQKVVMND